MSLCIYFREGSINGGYNCRHQDQQELLTECEEQKECGCCYCFSCPLGIEAEQEDLIKDKIDWDGLDGGVGEGEILLVNAGDDATQDEKDALWNYTLYMNRYDKKWLDEHGIMNTLCE